MKEATGELSTTVIAVVAIAAVLTIFTTLLLPYLKNSISAKMYCSSAVCESCASTEKFCKCTYKKNESSQEKTITCNNPNFKG